MSKRNIYHICLGTPEVHRGALEHSASSTGEVEWTINSKAKAGDFALFYLKAPTSKIVAKGVAVSDAERDNDPRSDWYGYFECYIHNLMMLETPVPLSMIRDSIPQWGYWKTPIKSTRVPDEFVSKLERLLNNSADVTTKSFPDVDEIDTAVNEGNRKLVMHYRIERDQTIVRKKKTQVLQAEGKLACEVCRFDFREKYGELGEGFCEVHHKLPLSKVKGEIKTKLEDLAVVCSNCHRIIHRKKSLLSIGELKKSLIA